MIESFTSKDIVAIITACNKNRVYSLKIDGLEIKFEPDKTINKQVPHIDDLVSVDLEPHLESEEDDNPIATDIFRMTLLAEDPLAYEQLMEKEHNEIRLKESQPSLS